LLRLRLLNIQVWGGLAALASFAAAAPRISGQCTFDWQPGGGLAGLDGDVYAATTWDPDGAGPQAPLLMVGGFFSNAGPNAAANIAAWNGTNWQPLGAGMNGRVFALAVYNGWLIAGGEFSTAGGTSAIGIAQWNGTTWQALGSGMNGTVAALTVHEGNLIAGGLFTTAGGASANDIAQWNGTIWQSLGSGMGGSFPYVQALTVYNGNLIAGGLFTSAGGTSINYVAQWNGTTWQGLGSGITGFGYVATLAVYNGTLIVGGQFPDAGGSEAHNIAQWNGTSWDWMGGKRMNSSPAAMTVFDGYLIVGGGFGRTPDGTIASKIAQWDGTTWQPLGSGMNNDVLALAVYDNYLIAGGIFTTASGNASASLARWGPPPPAITTQPSNQSACQGAAAGFVVSATGTGTLTYQWRRGLTNLTNGGAISGATTPNLTISPVAMTDADTNYNCVVTDACGGHAISDNAALTVTASPSANAGGPYHTCETGPVSLSGSAANFSSVSWSSNGTGTFTDSASLTASYTPSTVDVLAGSVVLTLTAHPTAPCATDATSTATLFLYQNPTANAGGPYAACAGSSPVSISGSTTRQASVAWSTSGDGTFANSASTSTSYTPGPGDLAAGSVTLTLTAAPIAPCNTPASSSATLTIQAPPMTDADGPYNSCGMAEVSLAGSASDAATVSWSSSGTGVFTNGNSINASYAPSAADVEAGTVQLTLMADPIAPCAMPATSTATLTIHTVPTISMHPVGATIGVGNSYTLVVSASGGGLAYQWKKDGNPIVGATGSSYTISSAGLSDAGAYSCLVSNDCGSVESSTAVLVVNQQATITLLATSPYVTGNQLVVSVMMSGATSVVVGAQFFLQYDTAVLQFAGVTSGEAPFLRPIYLAENTVLGTIDYAVGVDDGSPGTFTDSIIVRLTFNILQNVCTPTANLVTWPAVGPNGVVSRLVDDHDNVVVINTVNLPALVIDNSPPSVTICPPDHAAAANASCQAALTDLTIGVVASDNCTATANLLVTQSPAAGTWVGLGLTPVTLIVTDQAGNQATCLVNSTVADQTPPSIDGCPANIFTNVNSSNCTAIVTWDPPTEADNCGAATINRTSGPAPGSSFANGSVTTIVYTATDSAGLNSVCSFTVTVQASPDLNDDNVVDLLDTPLFVNVLLTTDMTPWRVARADVNCDGLADGSDIQPLLNLLVP